MSTRPSHGQLTAADEALNHQFPDTFAISSSSDPCWTERVYIMAGARDGSLAVQFGLGKYLNRGVMDAYASVSRGAVQTTLRASRALAPDPDKTVVGPLGYEVVRPLEAIRFSMAATETVPVSYDLLFEAEGQPFAERSLGVKGYRRSSEVLRYIQLGHATGWVEADGRRVDIHDENWFCIRDHSWGIRQFIGPPPPDRPEEYLIPKGYRYIMIWAPGLLSDKTGKISQLFLSYYRIEGPQGVTEHNDVRIIDSKGQNLYARNVKPQFNFHPKTRQPEAVVFDCVMQDGSEKRFTLEVAGATRSLLGLGLYYGYDGHYHGEYRGRLEVDGETVDDADDPTRIQQYHQLRDAVSRTSDGLGSTGFSAFQCEAVGSWPEYGLEEDFRLR